MAIPRRLLNPMSIMVFKLVMSAQKRWHELKGTEIPKDQTNEVTLVDEDYEATA